jgi:hypothetical protein
MWYAQRLTINVSDEIKKLGEGKFSYVPPAQNGSGAKDV